MYGMITVGHTSNKVQVDIWIDRPLSEFMKSMEDSCVPRGHRELAYLEWHWKKASLLSRRLLVLRREVAKLEGAKRKVRVVAPHVAANPQLHTLLHIVECAVGKLSISNAKPHHSAPSTCTDLHGPPERSNNNESHFFDFVRSVDSRADLDASGKRKMVTAYARRICFRLRDETQALRRRRETLRVCRRAALSARPIDSNSKVPNPFLMSKGVLCKKPQRAQASPLSVAELSC